ncbi:DUF6984 family protein [Siphonobacter aquaeclarae]|jgi:hypothetical protein|uniref:DUF6984 domain-containing protein n=1 Tax=Siphonobacter aquaeclarae TaxID=563176 RepID=A0A1G9RGR6_9BACT|nr:hypothetical protein [Siphonobacter aquaeclarae]SDM22250.1 hypothetical protein SAMN04488090_2886 [Siphonobacter aquaeclarae]
MSNLRPIRENEKTLIAFLLTRAGLSPDSFPYAEQVDEYEGGKMGSISVGGNPDTYAGDIIQARYTDSDGTDVVITLTKDADGRLLDLDFWKVDFSRLIDYPVPEKLTFA